ncbi:MAG: hypothetical protein NQU46_07225 [Methanolinea sp.]|nr:hypothetical protein [Methanolinea sp.]
MKRIWIHLSFLVFLCILVQGVAAIAVGNIVISPSGDLVSGQSQVRSSFVINFPASGGKTFDDANTLQLSSEMDNPTWTYAIVLDGVENPSKTEIGQNVNINGWLLSYPSRRELSMKVTMEATAPTVQGTAEKVVVGVRVLDSRGAAVASSEVVKKKLVINPAQIKESVQQAKNTLSQLRSRIDAMMMPGIDLSGVEQKYNEAANAIQSAESTTDYAKAQASLKTADDALKSAQELLVTLGIQKTIADADAKMEEVNALITDFRVNRSMGSDARLTPIMIAYDDAADLVSDAKDNLARKEYDQAQNKASEAVTKADSALADALKLKSEIESNPLSGAATMLAGVLVGGITIIIIMAVIAVIVVIGFLLFRRRRKWDELG